MNGLFQFVVPDKHESSRSGIRSEQIDWIPASAGMTIVCVIPDKYESRSGIHQFVIPDKRESARSGIQRLRRASWIPASAGMTKSDQSPLVAHILRRRTIVSLLLLGAAASTPSEAAPPGLYEISAETLMPHLEDNLRYAKTSERRCIRDDSVSGFFPILRHHSLHGCQLAVGEQRGDATYYHLVCDGTNGTTGLAQLHEATNRVEGVLAIQMGGKNMTFSQRIEAKRKGDC